MTPRIAYLLKKFPRLSETFILNEVLAQEALGQELHVFSRRPPDDEPLHPQFQALRAAVEYLPHSSTVDPWTELFGRQDDGLLARVAAVTRRFRETPHPRLPSLLAEAVHLRRRCAELGIEHVHVHFATDGAVLALLLSELGGPSYSITMHAKDIYRTTVDPALLERLIAGAAFVVTVCDANVSHLSGLVGPDAMARVRRLYNGIDLGAFSASGGNRDTDHVLAVGRLVEKKGLHVLVEALSLLAREGRAVRATIVGDGEEAGRLAALVAERGLQDRVTLTGPLVQDGVVDLLRRATLFCLPCLIGQDGNRDALPTVLLEALACGLPIVSTPVTGIPEIVDHGRAGVLVPENDARATADAIAGLLADPARRTALAAAGRRHVREHFDIGRSSAVLAGWFAGALSERGAACASPA